MDPQPNIGTNPLTRPLPAVPTRQKRTGTLMSPPRQTREEAVRQLKQEIGNSNEVLVQATAVFPFSFFPDTLTVDRGKVTITKRTFFGVAEVISVRIEDLLHVVADVGPFFGSVKITNRFFDAQKPYTVNYLWREDALRIKRVLQGYIIATQKMIDCSSFATKELALMLDELGCSNDRSM